MAEVQQYETLCKGCLRRTWMLRTLCHCHAAPNRMETGPSISVPPFDYERIMQLHSKLYITSYVHALLLYTPFVPKLNNLISPTSSDPSHLPTWHLIKYVMYLRHWKWICMFSEMNEWTALVHCDRDGNQCWNEADSVCRYKTAASAMFEGTQSYLKWLMMLIRCAVAETFSYMEKQTFCLRRHHETFQISPYIFDQKY